MTKFAWASELSPEGDVTRSRTICGARFLLATPAENWRAALRRKPPSVIGSGSGGGEPHDVRSFLASPIDGYRVLVVPLRRDPAAIRYRLYKPG